MAADDPHVVVIGGGFGGSYVARGLGHHGIRTTLVDSNGFQTFQPLLYQAATGLLPVSDIEYPLDEIRGVDAVRQQVSHIDLDAKRITLADGTALDADYIVLATGASVNFFGVEGAQEHALPLYTTAHARAIKARLQQLGSGGKPYSIVVVGAGATGVEVTGAISDVQEYVLPRTFPGFPAGHADLHIVDRGKQPLASMSAASQEYAHQVLGDKGVRFHLGRSVTKVSQTDVTLDDGSTLPAALTIWAGGLTVSAPTMSPAPETGPGGRITIGPDLRMTGSSDIYCIGDAAVDPRDPLPQLGSAAKQQGIEVAKSITRQIHGKEPHRFRYRDLGDMAMIRHDAAAVEMGAHHTQVTGMIAYTMWLGLHTYLLPGDQHRIDAVRAWVHEQVTGKSKFLVD